MSITWSILELIMTCIDGIYFFMVPFFQLGSRQWVQRKYLSYFLILYVVAITIWNNLTDNSFSALYITLSFIACYYVFFVGGKLIAKLFWILIPIALLYGIELSSLSFLTTIHDGVTLNTFTTSNIYRFQYLVLAKAIQSTLLVYFLRTKIDLHNFSYALLLPATLISFFSIFFLSYTQLLGFTDVDKSIAETILLRFGIAFLAVNSCYLLLIGWLQKKFKIGLQLQRNDLQEKLDQELESQQADLKQRNYQEIVASYNKLKDFQGEVQESLRDLWVLAKEHKLPQVELYLTKISRINLLFEAVCQTGDDVVDSILTSKSAIASLQRIELRTDIILPPKQLINSMDLATILINLLDNAIEGLQNIVPVDGADRAINLVMKIDGDHYKVEVKNPCKRHAYARQTQDQLTTFIPSPSSGLGLKVIKGMVDRYQGELHVSQENFIFTVVIKIPLNKISGKGTHAGKNLFKFDSLFD